MVEPGGGGYTNFPTVTLWVALCGEPAAGVPIGTPDCGAAPAACVADVRFPATDAGSIPKWTEGPAWWRCEAQRSSSGRAADRRSVSCNEGLGIMVITNCEAVLL